MIAEIDKAMLRQCGSQRMVNSEAAESGIENADQENALSFTMWIRTDCNTTSA